MMIRTAIFFLAMLLGGISPALAQSPVVSDAPVAPSFDLESADGKMVSLASMRGNVVLLSFGATWCEPCKEELKALEQLKKEYKDKPVRFLWVSIESEREASNGDLRNYAKKLKLTFPVLRDPDKTTFARFAARLRLPTILFFDKSGSLSTPNHVGMAAANVYMAKMRSRIDALLNKDSLTISNGR